MSTVAELRTQTLADASNPFAARMVESRGVEPLPSAYARLTLEPADGTRQRIRQHGSLPAGGAAS